LIPQKLIEKGFTFSHLFFVMFLIVLVMSAWLLFNLIKIFNNLKQENIFILENAASIRNIGWIIIVISFIKDLPEMMQVWSMRNQLDSIITMPFSINYELNVGLLFSGLAILAVAQIYKQAVKIADENNLTI